MAAHMHRVVKRQARRKARQYAATLLLQNTELNRKQEQINFLGRRFELIAQLLPEYHVARSPKELIVERQLPEVYRISVMAPYNLHALSHPDTLAAVQYHEVLLRRVRLSVEDGVAGKQIHLTISGIGQAAYYIAHEAITRTPPDVIRTLWGHLYDEHFKSKDRR